MRFPVVRECVRVQGRDGTFVVLAVDRARGVARLTSARRGAPIEDDVPLSSILPLAGDSEKPAKDENAPI
jgi:hypothetical protein